MNTDEMLIRYAERYETEDFINGDPSWFMHQVTGTANQEAMALLASCLSYGSRRQFMPKIQWLLDSAGGDVDGWVRNGRFEHDLPADDNRCFYRLYTCSQMNHFLRAYQQLLIDEGTLGDYVRRNASVGYDAIKVICDYFSSHSVEVIIPKDTQSACKRVCMFLRWMVRSGSPVDIGIWSDFIDRRTLIIPLDTHVLHQSVRLELLTSKTATMATAKRLTDRLSRIFPDDPLKGDFALFGYGVNA